MATLLEKLGLPTAIDTSNRFDLSCFHATTSRFYAPRVTYFHMFTPKEVWNMDARSTVKCLPMIRPAMCDIKVHNRFFYVPFFTIFKRWKEFLGDTPAPLTYLSSEIPICPYFDEKQLVNMLADTASGFSTSGSSSAHDFYIFTSSGSKSYRTLTDKGRTAYSILLGLGYNVNFNLEYKSNGLRFSALPLLAYLKVWLDWFDNSAFQSSATLSYLFDLNNSISKIGNSDLVAIFNRVTITYLEKDYFTAATLNPVTPNTGNLGSNISLPDITTDVTASQKVNVDTTTSANHTPVAVGSAISKYALDAVNAVTDYVKRHQLAGLQPFNRILAEYGVTLDDEVLQRSTFIGDLTSTIDVNEVLSNSYADDTVLGERAGYAEGGNSKKLDFHNDNFGCIICITTIVPRSSYTDGVKRHCLVTDRLSFFTPEYEHLGTEPIYVAEVRNNFASAAASPTTSGDSIFGFMPRYAYLKTAQDTVSGSFAIRSRKTLIEPWIIKRQFNSDQASTYASISEDFTVAKADTVNSPFVDDTEDNFVIFNMYHVNAKLPMHRMFDDYQWSNEGDNPQHVTIHNQGVQLT